MPTWVFWLVTVSVALVGIGLISLATVFDFYGHQVPRELTRAFGEALVVASFIASTVDQYIKRGLVSDLYKFIAGYGLPTEIQNKLLSEGEAAARSGDGAAEFFGSLDPFLNDDFHVGESFLVSLSVGGAAGKFGDFGDKRFVSLTPVDDELVSRHRLLPPSGS